MDQAEYEKINKAKWDERAPIHAASSEYKVQAYQSDPHLLSSVVQFDVPLLGDITGLNVVHLQCHIGTDTLSLARLGASSVTGLDLSGASIAEANKLRRSTHGSRGNRCRFVTAGVYDALDVLPRNSFDVVYTGIGALCWLHSIREWAAVVHGLLKPGGRLFIREAHPSLWSMDDGRGVDGLVVKYGYFERAGPMEYEEAGSYVEAGAHQWQATKAVVFNHGLGETVQALLDLGMTVTGLVEHESVPWEALPGQMSVDERGEWTLTDRPWRLPHTYTLQAVKSKA